VNLSLGSVSRPDLQVVFEAAHQEKEAMQRRKELEFDDPTAFPGSYVVNLRLDRVRCSSRAKVEDQPRVYICGSLGHIGGGQDRDGRGAGRREQRCDEDDRPGRDTHKSDSGQALENSQAG
jgi:predicted NUDIX family phosphoesterase